MKPPIEAIAQTPTSTLLSVPDALPLLGSSYSSVASRKVMASQHEANATAAFVSTNKLTLIRVFCCRRSRRSHTALSR